VLSELLGNLVKEVIQESQENKGLMDETEPKVPQVLQEFVEKWVQLDKLEIPVFEENEVNPALQVHQEVKDHPDPEVNPEKTVLMDHRDQKDHQEDQEIQDQWVHQEHLE